MTLTDWFEIDIIRVRLIRKHLHAKGPTVCINVLQHVFVLISAQPFTLPIKLERLIAQQQFLKLLLAHIRSVYIIHVCEGFHNWSALLSANFNVTHSWLHCFVAVRSTNLRL